VPTGTAVGNKTADGVTYFNDWLSGNGAVGHNVADFQVGVFVQRVRGTVPTTTSAGVGDREACFKFANYFPPAPLSTPSRLIFSAMPSKRHGRGAAA
jgi:hypothetical protein